MKTLNLYPIDYPFESLESKINSEPPTLILDPDFQRKYKWDKDGWERASKFIESCLMRIPLPACYFAESTGDKMLIIDGVQRLSTIDKFFSDGFKLEGLTAFEELNGKKFSELDKELQGDLKRTTIRCIILRRENPQELVQEIFSRLNQGAVQLSNQEIRHAIYLGSLDNLLIELAELEPIKLFGVSTTLNQEKKENKKNSRESEEQVLRFFALQENLSNYDNKLHKLLDNFMRTHQNSSNDEIDRLRNLFTSTLDKCLLVFGDNVFRDTTKKKAKQGLVYYDLLMWSFAELNSSFIAEHKTQLVEKFKELCSNEQFQRKSSGGLQQKSSILTRRQLWKNKIQELTNK